MIFTDLIWNFFLVVEWVLTSITLGFLLVGSDLELRLSKSVRHLEIKFTNHYSKLFYNILFLKIILHKKNILQVQHLTGVQNEFWMILFKNTNFR